MAHHKYLSNQCHHPINNHKENMDRYDWGRPHSIQNQIKSYNFGTNEHETHIINKSEKHEQSKYIMLIKWNLRSFHER
jgi:hypothetical protein